MILLICKAVIIINITNLDWVKQDEDTLNAAKHGCEKNYNSCLYKFYKRSKMDYSAICK